MKKFLLLLAFLAAGVLHAQVTFEKYHPEVDKIWSADQTYDEGYVLGTQKYFVVKLDKYGDVQWLKDFRSYNNMSHDIISSSDSSIMVVTTWDGDKKDIFLHKLSNNGDLIWQKKYGTSEDDYGFYVRQTADNGYVIIGTLLIKLDKDGNVEWQKESPVTLGVSNYVLLLKNGNILISKTGQLNCVSASGELLWTKSFKMGNYTAVEISSNIYYSGAKTIYKLDSDGNMVSSKTVSDYYVITGADGNSFVAAAKDTMIKLNTDLETLWSKQIPNSTSPTAIMKTSDNGYFLTGTAGWVLKTDGNGNHKSLYITSPKKDEILKPGTSYTLKWKSFDVSTLNIENSTDGGVNWSSLISNIINADSLIWTVPLNYGDYLLRISDAEHAEIKDYAGPFQVTWNNNVDYIAGNQIKMWVGNNGMGSHDPKHDGSGLSWPGGQDARPAIFCDGLVWGGLVDDKPNVNGNTYRYGLIPGKILDDGSADNRSSYKYNIWKINRYWDTYPPGDKKSQLEFNYANWPAELGAPYLDVNKDGSFSRGVDIPDYAGDEVLWFVSNDQDSNVTRFTYGSDPIGLEVQTTIYALNREEDLDDVVFKKYKIINKGNKTVNDMFLSYWSDPDLGYANDDFVGVDTILDLAYSYNGDNNDEGMYGINPPAVGYKILQGPVIASPNDSAYFNNKLIRGMKNLPAYAFHFYIGGNIMWVDPDLGNQRGTEMLYNNMRGIFWNKSEIIDPVSNLATKFPLSGDPVTGSGWYEGPGWPGGEPPDDRRMVISSGPFNFAPKDTQEIAIAIIMARGTDYLNSITELRRKAQVVQDFYNSRIITGTEKPQQIIAKYDLQQNYPNPFNPSTIIKYSIPQKSFVELSVYDILGKRVMSLVNEEKSTGNYEISFNARNLSSGVYYYQIKAGDYKAVKKMMLVK